MNFFKNYRAVSYLSLIWKLVERVVCVQLVAHLKTNNLYEIQHVFRSAYRQLHSTETTLLRVQNDLLQAVDNEGVAILVLLSLSAGFDTIDHQKLLNLWNQSFGIGGVALKWFESYLKDRTQNVQIGSCTSTPVTLKYGVPQGFCTWSYFIYYVHNPFWDHHSKIWVELSSLRGRYSVVYFLPTKCISIRGDSDILSWSLYQGYKDMDGQQPFETEWWQNRTDRDHHS